MSEQNAIDINLDDEIAELDKFNQEVLKKIAECCSKDRKFTYTRFQPCSLHDMGFISDENINCNLIYNQENLRENLIKMVENRLHTDIRVNVRGHVFNCHLTMLQISSVFFRKLKKFDDININSNMVTVVGFEKAYDWIIHDNAVPERDHIVELFLTAKYLEMPELLKQLWFCFEDTTQFSEGEAFKLFIETLAFEETTLQQLLLTRISYFFFSAVSTVQFLQLMPHHVHAMLESNVVAVNNEFEILMCALRWMMFNWDERKQHIDFLMSAVRFGLMPPWCLLSLKAKQSMPEMREICETPSVMEKIDEGLSYSVTQQSLIEQSLQLRRGSQREWIIDENAEHHHEYKCPKWNELNFEHFNIYIDKIINTGPQFYKTLKPKTPENMMTCCKEAIKEISIVLTIN